MIDIQVTNPAYMHLYNMVVSRNTLICQLKYVAHWHKCLVKCQSGF